MKIRKRYSSPLALILCFLGLCFTFMNLPLVAFISFLLIWFYATEVCEDPTETVKVSEMLRAILRMLPYQALVVAVVFVVSGLFLGSVFLDLVIGILVVSWFVFSIYLPIMVSKSRTWYFDNHIFVVIGYMLLCVAAMFLIGPFSFHLVYGF